MDRRADDIAPLPREVLELAEQWMLISMALGFAPPMVPQWALILAAEVHRLHAHLRIAEEARATAEAALDHEKRQRAIVEAEFADQVVFARSLASSDASGGTALVDALEIIDSIARRGLLTNREKERVRALRRAVPS